MLSSHIFHENRDACKGCMSNEIKRLSPPGRWLSDVVPASF
jgi:hypothetical protein